MVSLEEGNSILKKREGMMGSRSLHRYNRSTLDPSLTQLIYTLKEMHGEKV